MEKFKVGDKVNIPTTKSHGAYRDRPQSCNAVSEAKLNKQKYLFITATKYEGQPNIYCLNVNKDFNKSTLSTFLESDLTLYVEPKTSPCAAHDKECEDACEEHVKTIETLKVSDPSLKEVDLDNKIEETLLEKANRLYPKGTKFNHPNEILEEKNLTSSGEFKQRGDMILDNISGWSVYMEDYGWAEIIETAPKVEEKVSFGEVEEEDIYDAVRRMREQEEPIKPLGATKHDQGKVSREFESGMKRDSDETKPYVHNLQGYTRLRFGYLTRMGARNYGDGNFLLGSPSDDALKSLDRHLAKFLDGDRSEDHLASMIFNIQLVMLNEKREGMPADHYFKK